MRKIIPLLAVYSAILCSCERTNQSEQRGSSLGSATQMAARAIGLTEDQLRDLDPHGVPCTLLPADTIELIHEHIAGPENGELGKSGDVFGLPDGTNFMADPEKGSVIQLSPTGQVVREWGRRGLGPNELIKPNAIAVLPDNSTVVRSGPSLKLFDSSGKYVKSIPHAFPVQDIAVGRGGLLMITAKVELEQVEAFREPVPYVWIMKPDLTDLQAVATVDTLAMNERPFLAAAWTDVFVSTLSNGDFAVWFAQDQWVDIYRGAERIATIRGCFPEGIADRYALQRQKARYVYQSALRLTRGVWSSGTDEISLLAAHKADRRAFISVFDLAGTPLASYTANIGGDLGHFGEIAASFRQGEILTWNRPQFTAHLDRWQMPAINGR